MYKEETSRHLTQEQKEREEIIRRLAKSDAFNFVTDIESATKKLTLKQLQSLEKNSCPKTSDTPRPRRG